MKLGLKVDVDTLRGTREGVPGLIELFRKHGVCATFLFSVGPDHTGRAIKRVFRRGFMGKVQRTSVVKHYGVRTLLYGTLLPGPWHPWFGRSVTVYEVLVKHGHSVRRCGLEEGRTRRAIEIPTWMFEPAACCRVRVMAVPTVFLTGQVRTELIGTDGVSVENVAAHVLTLTRDPAAAGHVFTLHAELEGMRLAPVLEELLGGWKAQGWQIAPVRALYDAVEPLALPRCEVAQGTVPGRSGTLLTQGDEFLAEADLAHAA